MSTNGMPIYGTDPVDPNAADPYGLAAAKKAAELAKQKAAAEAEHQKLIADYQANPGTAFNPKENPGLVTPTGPDGKPLQPGFVSIGDDKTGLLKDPYNLRSTLNSDALNQLRDQTLSQGPSKWSMLQQQIQGDDLAQNQASQVQQAQNGLATQGGLRSGAGERLASQGMRQGMIGRQQMQSNLANQDEQNRQTNLRALPGMEQANAGYNDNISKYNIEGAKNEIFQRRAYDVNNYNESMKGWAAAKTAQAAPSGGKK
jgi:hypothetical protein